MQLPFTTVLVTTDLSPLGDAALPVAFRLARDHGAKCVVLTVVETLPTPSPLYAHYYPRASVVEIDRSREAVRSDLAARITPELAGDVRWEAMVGEGEPAGEIARIAREIDASVTVIATHGRTGLRHFLLGSIAERVLRQTHCAVLLVR